MADDIALDKIEKIPRNVNSLATNSNDDPIRNLLKQVWRQHNSIVQGNLLCTTLTNEQRSFSATFVDISHLIHLILDTAQSF